MLRSYVIYKEEKGVQFPQQCQDRVNIGGEILPCRSYITCSKRCSYSITTYIWRISLYSFFTFNFENETKQKQDLYRSKYKLECLPGAFLAMFLYILVKTLSSLRIRF